MLSSILIANRGEIACRVIRTAKRLGIRTIAVYSDPDRHALFATMADEAYRIGPAPARDSYLNGAEIIRVAKECDAEAIHPGYGFLSENVEFAETCEKQGIQFIGPSATAIRAMGLKDQAKELMAEAGVPVVPGYNGADQSDETLIREADGIGYPVLIKAVAGGGGKGMRCVEQSEDMVGALADVRREAMSAFGDDRVLIEKFLTQCRHVEVQVFADSHGNAVHLFERDCSLQRRHQKVIEEAPAPGMTPELRERMGEAAVQAAKAVDYLGAGTVEFVADCADTNEDGCPSLGAFYFMEMNTRLQVEHPVTEMITGLDLVEWQLRVASGEPLPAAQEALSITGHAVEARVYAEQPAKGFMPSIGRIHQISTPDEDGNIRVDTGIRDGDEITLHYDPMIAKVIAHGATRHEAFSRLQGALSDYRLAGCKTNIDFLNTLISDTTVQSGHVDTGFVDRCVDQLVDAAPVPDEALAIAAIGMLGMLNAQRSNDPWDCLYGWRAWGNAEQNVNLLFGDQTHHIRVTSTHAGDAIAAAHVDTGNGPLNIRIVEINPAGGSARFEIENQGIQAHWHRVGDCVTVFLAAGRFTFTIPDADLRDDQGDTSEDRILAPLPGVITEMFVSPGDNVSAKQPLLVLEAMKMNHTLTAPGPAVVESVLCASGDQVAEGSVLLTLTHDPAGGES